MAFGKHESYDNDIISYKESVDNILINLRFWGCQNNMEVKKDEV